MRPAAALAATLAAALPGCAPLLSPVGLAVTAGATAGTMAAQERGFGGAVSDNALALAINDAWLQNDLAIWRKVSTSISEGVVVLTGSVRYRETAERAEAIARGVPGVRAVVNRITVEEWQGLGTLAADRLITLRLRASLTVAADVNAVNYAIDTVSGTVVLSGIARDQAELDRVVALAKATPGVKDVVTAVRLRSEPPSAVAMAAAPGRAPEPSRSAVHVAERPAAARVVTAEALLPP